jgi:hypothetical protein
MVQDCSGTGKNYLMQGWHLPKGQVHRTFADEVVVIFGPFGRLDGGLTRPNRQKRDRHIYFITSARPEGEA